MSLLTDIADLLYPAVCAGCEHRSSAPFCITCDVSLITPQNPCKRCGQERLHSFSGAPCLACMGEKPAIGALHGSFLYGGALADAIRKLKYSRRLHVAKALAMTMASNPPPWLADYQSDLVAPVASRFGSYVRRGFNPVHLIAEHLFGDSCVQPLARPTGALRKPQAARGLAERLKMNKAGFWRVTKSNVRGAKILLIDDVVTTGATLNGLASALLECGAIEVRAWTAAVVERD